MDNQTILDAAHEKFNYNYITKTYDTNCKDNNSKDNKYKKLDCKDNNRTNIKYGELKKAAHSTCYKIEPNYHLMQDPVFYFLFEGKTLYTAIERENVIYICEGNQSQDDLKKEINSVAKITRNKDNYNTINTGDQEFKLIYATYYPSNDYSIKVSFQHNEKMLYWKPKTPKSSTSLNGEHNHPAIASAKNMILQNNSHVPTFILRAISKEAFEAEVHPDVDPLIAFTIAISQIVGPLSYQKTFSII